MLHSMAPATDSEVLDAFREPPSGAASAAALAPAEACVDAPAGQRACQPIEITDTTALAATAHKRTAAAAGMREPAARFDAEEEAASGGGGAAAGEACAVPCMCPSW